MLTKPFKPLALAFLVNLIISVEDKIKYKKKVFILKYCLSALGNKTKGLISACIFANQTLSILCTNTCKQGITARLYFPQTVDITCD